MFTRSSYETLDIEEKSNNMRWLLLLNIFVCVAFVLALGILPKNNRVAVFTAPWTNQTSIVEIISAANGQIINGGKADWIMVADSNSETFIEDLYSAGALLVIDGELAAACL